MRTEMNPIKRFFCGVFGGAAVLALASGAFAQATIEGTVGLLKSAAKAPAIPRYENKKLNIGPPDPSVAVVYLEGNFPPAETNSPPVLKMEQQHFQFKPRVLPVQKGTTIEFPNMDDEYHNVLSYSKAKHFDLGRYRKDEKPPTIKFDKPGVVDVNCEIHEHMNATILVLETPYFTKTDTNGVYRLEKLPAGKYTLKAWLSEKMVRSQPVELKEGETLRVNFSE